MLNGQTRVRIVLFWCYIYRYGYYGWKYLGHFVGKIKGIVHLNIIFSYMKVNKICNLDHPVY